MINKIKSVNKNIYIRNNDKIPRKSSYFIDLVQFFQNGKN
jgi:hypothetical protein